MEWTIGASVRVMYMEAPTSDPIEGKIKWIKPRGRRMEVPGFGIQFPEAGKERLAEMFDRWDIR